MGQHRTNVIAWYGDSGNGKTSLIGSLCKFMMEKYPNKKGRLYTADNTAVLEPYIEGGVLDVYRVDVRDHPFETLDCATRGYWPAKPDDPKTKMLPPTPADWEKYLFFAYEGLTNFSDLMLSNRGGLAKMMGGDKHIGPGTRPGEDGISFKDGEFEVGGNTRTHYFLVQKLISDLVRNTYALQVPLVTWTAHEVRAVEDNKPIYGPAVAGKAATKDVQKWFDALIHVHTVKKGNDLEYRLYLKEHYDDAIAKGIPFKAVTRLPLPLLDRKTKLAVEGKWDALIPQYIEWTGDSDVIAKYMDLRKKMRELANQIIIKPVEKKENASA